MPAITALEAGGATICWYDSRGGATFDVFAQRVDLAGMPQWKGNGVAISTAANNQFFPVIVGDGAGGAIVAWEDRRAGADIYAQEVDRFGVLSNPSTAVPQAEASVRSIALSPNVPNPFRVRTVIPYHLREPARVRLDVHDLSGRRIATLVDAHRPAGRHLATLEAGRLPSGVYTCRITAGRETLSRTLQLVR